MIFFDAEQLTGHEFRPGLTLRTAWLENMLLSNIDLLPNAVIPAHQHPQEQISVILSGEVTMTIAGETRLLKPGDICLVAGNVEHGGLAGAEGARMIDIFSPVRPELQFS